MARFDLIRRVALASASRLIVEYTRPDSSAATCACSVSTCSDNRTCSHSSASRAISAVASAPRT